MSEKFVPYKNVEGQIIDPEVARKMADDEKMLVKDGSSHESANDTVDTWGETYHAEKMTPTVVEKMKNVLSNDELKVIREILTHPSTHFADQFKELLFADLSTDEDE